MTPKVSICIPTYLQTQFLRRTLDSISVQDYDDYEIVITDDSPDETVEKLVREYSFGDKLTYVRNTHQLGSPANWNEAIRLAKGEYVKILHHDDWLAGPTSLAEFIALLDLNPHAGFAFSGTTVMNAQTLKTRHHYATAKEVDLLRYEPTSLFYGNFIGAPSATIVRRSIFIEFDEKLVWLVDIAQYMKMLSHTCFVATQEPLVVNLSNWHQQITNSCTANKRLNVYEHFYLYDLIKTDIPAELDNKYLSHLVYIIYMFNVRSTDEICQLGYDGPIPKEIRVALKKPFPTRRLDLLKWYLPRRLALLQRQLWRYISIM